MAAVIGFFFGGLFWGPQRYPRDTLGEFRTKVDQGVLENYKTGEIWGQLERV